MAGPAGIQPQTPAPPAAANQDERLRLLISLLHTPGGPGGAPGQELEVQAQALNVEAIVQQLPPQPPPQYGELPGEGYLYAEAPEKREAALVHTTPDRVRAALLRAIEVAAMNVQLPFSEHNPGEWAKAALAFSQAYLLLDPSVDEMGVPVGAQAMAQGEAQEGVAQAQADAQEGLETHKAIMAGHVAAHGSGQEWTHPHTKSGHPLPPKVKPNPAEAAIEAKNRTKSEELRGARGDLPRPKPRVGE